MGGWGWSKQLDGGTRAECVSHLPYSWQARGACLNHNISACSVTGKRCEVVIYRLDQVFDVIHWIRVMWSFIKWKSKLVVVSHTTCKKNDTNQLIYSNRVRQYPDMADYIAQTGISLRNNSHICFLQCSDQSLNAETLADNISYCAKLMKWDFTTNSRSVDFILSNFSKP